MTEITLFKKCVETPISLQLNDLNLASFESNAASQTPTNSTMSEQQRSAQRLFHMAWSGITKYIRQVTVGMSKAIDMPGLGYLVPTTQFIRRAALSKNALEQLNERDISELVLVASSKLLEECGLHLAPVKMGKEGAPIIQPSTLAAESEEAQ